MGYYSEDLLRSTGWPSLPSVNTTGLLCIAVKTDGLTPLQVLTIGKLKAEAKAPQRAVAEAVIVEVE